MIFELNHHKLHYLYTFLALDYSMGKSEHEQEGKKSLSDISKYLIPDKFR